MKRAADSIALNIAEGSTGQSKPEFVRFLGYGLRSSIEIISALYIAKRRNLIDEKQFELYYNKTEKLITSIQALRKTLR
jgi:four helix bundle protein